MNIRLVAQKLGIVAILIAATMVGSLPWAHPALGYRSGHPGPYFFETHGFVALLVSIVISTAVGGGLYYFGRNSSGSLFRKEAMAIVGLSWVLATVLGAMPFYFSGTGRSATVRLMPEDDRPLVQDFAAWHRIFRRHWVTMDPLDKQQRRILEVLLEGGSKGVEEAILQAETGLDSAPEVLANLVATNSYWEDVIILPDDPRDPAAPSDRRGNYRIHWATMSIPDCLFESQSGFSTTGATVISELEDPYLVPHCILFWRSSMHFLGGLGIIVLFVVVLGQGSAGKALMRAEMPGPSKEGSTARMQHTAWLFAGTYCGLNLVLTIILLFEGLTFFDALCHAFGTLATGGFSTWNASLGHFDSSLIEYTVTLFMILAGTNFTLLYFSLIGQPLRLLRDVEWRVYMMIIVGVTAVIILFGMAYGDFGGETFFERFANALRYGLFQVVSILTTTGFGTHDFDHWNSFGRGVLFLLMFVGGCAGSTGGGLKVIRHVLFLKIMALEVEQSFHPTVVRPIKLGGNSIEDADLRKNILVYFSLILVIFVFSWLFLITVEPDATWGNRPDHKLIDSASGIAATLNNIGPGLGTVGATRNYAHFGPLTKLLYVWLMMVGRVEIFVILVLMSPSFWRHR
jgi:trk system potassium uptake protein TrkH